MKTENLLSLLSTVLFLVTCATASLGDVLGVLEQKLVPRQGSSSGSNSASITASPTASATGSNTVSGTGSNSGSGSGSSSGSAANTQSGSASNSGSTMTGSASSGTATASGRGNSTSITAVDPRLPPGGVQMLTPAPTAQQTFVKVGQNVTFAWNYTSLSVPPSYIDIMATNRVNSQTYTIAANQSWAPTQTVTWDTGDNSLNTASFVVATYTLMIYDAASDPTAVASAGYLAAANQFQFGMYTPQPYTPFNEFRCATCSGAMSVHEKQAWLVLLGTCTLTVISFTWSASGFGLF